MTSESNDLDRRLLALEIAVSVLGANTVTGLAPKKVVDAVESHGHSDYLADMFRRIGELLNGDIPDPVQNVSDDATDKLLDLEADIIESQKQIFALGMVVKYLIRQLRKNDLDIPSSLAFATTLVDEAQAIVSGYDPDLLPNAIDELNERIEKLWNPDE